MVRAMRGVMMRSMVGSLAKLRKSTVRSMDPFSSKSCLKKCAVSMLTPMAANTMAKGSEAAVSPPSPPRDTRPARIHHKAGQ